MIEDRTGTLGAKMEKKAALSSFDIFNVLSFFFLFLFLFFFFFVFFFFFLVSSRAY